MRGYELDDLRQAYAEDKFRIPMRGYENGRWGLAIVGPEFRIPMRGYEVAAKHKNPAASHVPNPHEGL